jgi:hypothetical protein
MAAPASMFRRAPAFAFKITHSTTVNTITRYKINRLSDPHQALGAHDPSKNGVTNNKIGKKAMPPQMSNAVK